MANSIRRMVPRGVWKVV